MNGFLLAADFVLLVHALFVLFVVVGLLLILVGGLRGWRWVRHPGFRFAHLVAIAVVVLQSWFGMTCPLTTFEMHLRARAGAVVYDGSFIAHHVGRMLYYPAPPWVFVLLYTTFGGAVLWSWFAVRPHGFRYGPATMSRER